MTTDLEHHMQHSPMVDTHEHLYHEDDYIHNGPDILQELFGHYILTDLKAAGLTAKAEHLLFDKDNPDIAARWAGAAQAWRFCQHTGYGEAIQQVMQDAYGMDEITPEGLIQANKTLFKLRRPGERARTLKDVGRLVHVQVDDLRWECRPDAADDGLIFYDISWTYFVNGLEGFDQNNISLQAAYEQTGVEVRNLDTLRQAMEGLFALHGPPAVAVKSQHAYARTLHWEQRDEAAVENALAKRLAGKTLTEAERLCLGDWCLAQGVEGAIEYDLPFKIHTGYYAGSGRMPLDYIPAGQLYRLLQQYPQARFILMHIAYPYNDELVAVAKHYPNVYVDLCWAWSIDPFTAADFVRKMIHSVPINKLFAFGGDTHFPNMSVAFAKQARRWLYYALQGEVGDGLISETEAIQIAKRLMLENQVDCFELDLKV